MATHPRVFSPPAPIERALEFTSALRARHLIVPTCLPLKIALSGPKQWLRGRSSAWPDRLARGPAD